MAAWRPRILIRRVDYHQMEGEFGRPETDEAQVVESHRLIVEALRARDPDRAAEVIDLHFADVRARIDHLGRPGKPAMTAPESP